MKLIIASSIALLALSACNPPDAKPTAATTQKPATPAAAPSPGMGRLDPAHVVAEWSGQKLTYGELMQKRESVFKKMQNKYLQELHQAEQREVEGYVIEDIVTKGAKAAGKSEEEFLKSLAPVVPEVSDADILAFYDQQVKASGQPLDAVKERIRGFLVGNKQREQVKAAIDKMKADAKFNMTIPAPETAKVSFDLTGRPAKGPANAKVTLVEFSDFQCPYCSRAIGGVDALLKQFPNDLRVVFFHYPLDFHDQAKPAAMASQCANLQGKFWEFHDKLFANQGSLGSAAYAQYAKDIGLDEAKFTACLADPATKSFVEKDFEVGSGVGVEGTPSFFLNGVPTASGVPTADQVKAML